MGFILTLIYIFCTIVSPEQFGDQWADYRVLLYLAALTFLFSLPELLRRRHLLSCVQLYLLLGFTLAVALSKVAHGWFGGVIVAWRIFLPSVGVFFFIVANVTTVRRLKILALTIVGSTFAVVAEALCGYYFGFRGDTFVLQQSLFAGNRLVGEFSRLRGVGNMNDPNDFAQIMLIALPLLFLAWRRGRLLANSVIVLFPSAVLLWAIYLTHSRGALLALVVLFVMAIRRRIGTTASLVLTATLVLALFAVNFTGGRQISVDGGADRLWIWASGLEMFKSAPVFGVGFGSFMDFSDLTAHNSFVLCLAELGLVGSLLWVALIVTTLMGLNRIIKLQDERPGESILAEMPAPRIFLDPSDDLPEEPSPARANRFATPIAPDVGDEVASATGLEIPEQWILAIRMAFVSFLTTSWFLSRTYQIPMYLILGLATAAILLQRNVAESAIRKSWIFVTLAVEASTIAFIYLIVRLRM
jgi:O-antigen ligase